MGEVLLHNPTRFSKEKAYKAQDLALSELEGKVVGIIDNAKPNFEFLAKRLGEVLQEQYGVAEVVYKRKPSAAVPAEDEVYDELADRCDLVITGSGD